LFAAEGADAWYARPLSDFAPAGLACPKCGGERWEKEHDILDVWFDSGASHLAVCDNDRFEGLSWPADVYLEGHDQHRGWFQSSLLVGVVTHRAAPYRAVVVHGHVLDADGRKMSKSLGNVIAPQNLIKEYGADVVRLWAASVDFREDIPVAKETLTRIAEAYRKVRNTLRFLLSNLADFDPATDAVPVASLRPLDAYFLRRGRALAARLEQAYRDFEFHVVYHQVNNFCAVDLSAVYLDILKDRLYCSHPRDDVRRSAQTVLYRIARALATLTAPVLAFTADEAWEHLPGADGRSVHLEEFERLGDVGEDADRDACFGRLLALRDEAYKLLEVQRKEGLFGKSLEAALVLSGDRGALDADIAATEASLEELCIVSQVIAGEGTTPSQVPGPSSRCAGLRAPPRCWQVCADPPRNPEHPELCPRCLDVVLRLGGGRMR
jgi:isoleucyl-tRNA synthetase